MDQSDQYTDTFTYYVLGYGICFICISVWELIHFHVNAPLCSGSDIHGLLTSLNVAMVIWSK